MTAIRISVLLFLACNNDFYSNTLAELIARIVKWNCISRNKNLSILVYCRWLHRILISYHVLILRITMRGTRREFIHTMQWNKLSLLNSVNWFNTSDPEDDEEKKIHYSNPSFVGRCSNHCTIPIHFDSPISIEKLFCTTPEQF